MKRHYVELCCCGVSNWDAHCHQYGVDVGAIALGGNICGGFSDITLNGFFGQKLAN